VRDGRYRRSEGRALIEGPHLLASLLQWGSKPRAVIVTEEAQLRPEIGKLQSAHVVVSSKVFDAISDAETPQGIAAEIDIPEFVAKPGDQVFLEGIQDAGNVGAILRSAAAFSIGTVVLDRACADPWSPKVLRAAMGGHFALAIKQADDLKAEVKAFGGQVVCTVARQGVSLSEARLSRPLGWIFGSEGQGVSRALQELSDVLVTIPLAPGTESLNVGAAAAICLYTTTT
jgi:TrmH family RNA methyltransferase